MKKILILFIVIFLISGCAFVKLNIAKRPIKLDKPIETIALMPSGGIAADSIGIEMLNYGYNIVDTATTTSHMTRVNMTEVEYSSPQNLRKLNSEGVDSIMIVKAVQGYDGNPNSITCRIILTNNGQLLVGATWTNGGGGVQGSMADRMHRDGLSDATQDMAKGLAKALRN